ncbi:hypothetical protein AK830_g2990 [Neonectria ditissima]|uniref:Uncharacterized protein n=1 Tax=Neonectria ditissima TaxID=78410 RepID=A0A0P7B0T7_9HYPO|nr:hypothetical protein AK830_g2990 [Neonectria ditissima]
MFDVIWTDPDRELVGEHRAKKEKKREMQQSREKDKSISSRSSMSMLSSRSSTDSPFGFLRSRGLKPSISDKSNSKSKSTVSSGLLTPSILSSRSPLSTDSDAGSYRHSAQADTSSVYSETVPAETSERSSSGPDTSQVVSALGSASYVTKRTEVTWKPRYSDTDCQDVLSEILISSEPDIEQPMTPPSSPRNRSMPLPLLRSDSPVAFIPGLRIPSQPKAPLALTFAPNNPEAWRPPEEWDCVSPESRIADLEQSINEMQISGSNKSPRLSSNFDLLQKEVKRMAAANPEVVLSRLKEVWSTAQDENLYRELEMEKKRWMLSALRHLDPVPQCNTPGDSMADLPSAAASTVLAFNGLVPRSTSSDNNGLPHVGHAALACAVPERSSRLRPLGVSVGILRNVHKSLKQGGSLQMTLIDPLPCAGLGRRMRTWLEEHLLLNLEKNFRCMNPSKLFPGWLGEASLRGRGSTMTSAKFYAVPTSVRYPDGDSDPFVDQARIDEAVRAEVRSLVGRMLWMEVWGAYVTADKWWWEDEGCVEECLELATFWEYKIIEGVKDS